MLRVGTIVGNRKPKYDNFKPVVVMTPSSPYGSIGPYSARNRDNYLVENLWQFSKIYTNVPKSTQRYSQWDNTIIWDHPAEQHMNDKDEPLEAYWEWRHAGFTARHAIRYPVGMKHRKECYGCIVRQEPIPGTENDAYPSHFYSQEDHENNVPYDVVGYSEARRKVYIPEYINSIRELPQFLRLRRRLENGENLLIIEVDGPRQESLEYYIESFGVEDDFIEDNTIVVNERNMDIMLRSERHAFGHGYALALALTDMHV